MGLRKSRVNLDGFVKILNRLPVVAKSAVDTPTVIIGLRKSRVDLDGFVKILNRLSMVTKADIGKTTAIIGNVIIIGNFQGMLKQHNAVLPVPDLCPCNNEKT